MSMIYGPKIIKDSSLVLNVDFSNKRCYSGIGSTCNDLSKSKNLLTIYGSPTFTSSTYGGYFTLSGTSQYMQVSNAAPYNFTTDLFTLEAWMAWSVGAGSYGRIFEHDYATGYALDIFPGGALTFEVNGNSTTVSTGGNYGDGIWRHYVAVRTGSTTASIYINGVNVVNGNIVGGTLTNTSALQIGSSSYATTLSVQIARVYNRALTATEILQNYHASKAKFGL